MSEQEARMLDLLRAGAPPALDRAFELAVLARAERQRFYRRLLTCVMLTLASVPLLALVAPLLNDAAHSMVLLMPHSDVVMGALLLAGLAALWPLLAQDR